MALHRYGDFRVEVFYFDSPCSQPWLPKLKFGGFRRTASSIYTIQYHSIIQSLKTLKSLQSHDTIEVISGTKDTLGTNNRKQCQAQTLCRVCNMQLKSEQFLPLASDLER